MLTQEFPLETVALAGIPLVHAAPKDAAEQLCRMAKSSKESNGLSFHLVNAYTMALAHEDLQYAELLRSSTANFPDGKPLTWWKHKNGIRLQQIRGPQLFEDVMDLGRSSDVRHYLLGSSEETLILLEASLRRRYPGVNIVGTFSPPFRKLTNEEILVQDATIAETGAEIVWVGLGTPKQDWEVGRIAAELPVLSIAVGAAFDFSAGTKPTAPEWMSKLGLEWLFRFMSEPRRLWKRYLVGNLIFLWSVISHRPAQGRNNQRTSS